MNEGRQTGAGLSPAKLRLFALLREREGAAVASGEAVTRRGSEGPCALSFAQERMWFFEQLEPGTPAHNVPLALRVEGRLDVRALERALSEIVRRHEVLRTTFGLEGERPTQLARPPAEVRAALTDLTGDGAAACEEAVARLAEEEARRPFDLSAGPLLRCRLLRLSDEENVVLLTMHHIASDGWSMGVLVREVAALYTAFAQGRPSPLAEPSVQYADFAVWQRRRLTGEPLAQLLAYWGERLASLPACGLRPDRRPQGEPSLRGETESMLLPTSLAERLRDLGRREGASLFMTMLAAFQTLVLRYTWQEDVVVGTPIANRNRLETEPLIGFFVNTLVLRTDLSGNPTFRELLARTRETTLGAYAHQDLPFDKLVEHLRPGRSLGRVPLFQIFFALNNNPAHKLELPGLRLTRLALHNGVAKFDLEVSLVEHGRGVTVTAIYKTDLFERATVARMLGHYAALLEAAAGDPGARLLDLPLEAGEATAAPTAPALALGADLFAFE